MLPLPVAAIPFAVCSSFSQLNHNHNCMRSNHCAIGMKIYSFDILLFEFWMHRNRSIFFFCFFNIFHIFLQWKMHNGIHYMHRMDNGYPWIQMGAHNVFICDHNLPFLNISIYGWVFFCCRIRPLIYSFRVRLVAIRISSFNFYQLVNMNAKSIGRIVEENRNRFHE